MNQSLPLNQSPLFEKLVDSAVLPRRSTSGAGAYDLYALEACSIGPYTATKRIRTGIRCNIPPGYCGQTWCRSSLGTRGVIVQGGFIDSDYRGEVSVVLDSLHEQVTFEAGDRIAQMTVVPCYYDTTYDGAVGVGGDRVGGFGSTGK